MIIRPIFSFSNERPTPQRVFDVVVDGNNVDLEIEKVNQAANTLKYNALITSINNKFNGMKSVIKWNFSGGVFTPA